MQLLAHRHRPVGHIVIYIHILTWVAGCATQTAVNKVTFKTNLFVRFGSTDTGSCGCGCGYVSVARMDMASYPRNNRPCVGNGDSCGPAIATTRFTIVCFRADIRSWLFIRVCTTLQQNTIKRIDANETVFRECRQEKFVGPPKRLMI